MLAFKPWYFNRFEWVMATAMGSMGIHILINPDSLIEARWHLILGVFWFPLLCAMYVVGGAVRLYGLILFTGGKVWASHLRAFGAAIGCLLWAQVGIALILGSIDERAASPPTIWLFFLLSAGELLSVYMAELDAKSTTSR